MDKFLNSMSMGDLPEGFPPVLAISILTSGQSEDEVRQYLVEENFYPQTQIDKWLKELRSKGWFEESSSDSHTDALSSAFDNLNTNTNNKEKIDGVTYLWSQLLHELEHDESDFKHRVAAFDSVLKQSADISWLGSSEAKDIFPFTQELGEAYPWQGCKCVASAVMLLVSPTDASSKIKAIKPVSKSLGGLEIPDRNKLKLVRDPYILSKGLKLAYEKARSGGVCTAFLVSTTDVEIMRNPGTFFKSRPGTFAHTFAMTVSPEGVHILHGYGPRGCTLLQHMTSHRGKYPLSFEEAEEWTKAFEGYASDRGGTWTKEVNEAYAHCFHVDLVELECMRIGSQLDAYTSITSVEFDDNTVQENFKLLPQRRSGGRKIRCRDGDSAKAQKPPSGYIPDGGVKQYYIPRFSAVDTVVRCSNRMNPIDVVSNVRQSTTVAENTKLLIGLHIRKFAK